MYSEQPTVYKTDRASPHLACEFLLQCWDVLAIMVLLALRRHMQCRPESVGTARSFIITIATIDGFAAKQV